MKHQSQQKKGKLASRKHLSVDPLFKRLHKDFLGVSDHREGDPDISMADALMSGFAVFSLKDPSLLAFDQRRVTEGNERTCNPIPQGNQQQLRLQPVLVGSNFRYLHGSTQKWPPGNDHRVKAVQKYRRSHPAPAADHAL